MRHLVFKLVAVAVVVCATQAVQAAFTPTDLGGLHAWYDGANIDGANNSTLSDGGNVDTWVDSSGNGYTMSVVNGTPTYSATGMNGHSTVHLPDTGAGLNTSGGFGMGGPTGGDIAYTMFVLWTTNNNDGTEQHPFQFGHNDGSDPAKSVGIELQGGSGQLMIAGSFGKDYLTSYNGPYGNVLVTAAKSLGTIDTSLNLYVDGNSTGTPVSAYTDANDIVNTDDGYIGFGADGINGLNDGDVAEVILFARLLSASEQNQVGYYLEQKYGLDTAYTPPISVPEPAASLLAIMAFTGLGLLKGRRNHRSHDRA